MPLRASRRRAVTSSYCMAFSHSTRIDFAGEEGARPENGLRLFRPSTARLVSRILSHEWHGLPIRACFLCVLRKWRRRKERYQSIK